MSTVVTRMGDGSTVLLTRDEIRREILEGSEAAAVKAKIPVLEENEVTTSSTCSAVPAGCGALSAATRRS